MTASIDFAGAVRRLFSEASDDLIVVLGGGLEAAAIATDELRTLRDWLESTGYLDREPLIVAIACLFAAAAEGSLCLNLSVERLTERLRDWSPGNPALWAERIAADFRAESSYPLLIGKDAGDPFPVILLQTEATRRLYFQRHLAAEQELVTCLGPRLHESSAAKPRDHGTARLADILHDVLVTHPLQVTGRPLRLDDDQRHALDLALARGLTVISGGPGTGKTSIVVTLLRCLVRLGVAPERIALAAPTGRAAQRLTDSLRGGLAAITPPLEPADEALATLAATTLHQLLGFMPSRNLFRKHAENPIDADVVIVDEASMVGVELWAQLVQATRPDARLVFLGDKDQLPSVDAGAVLAQLAPRDTDTAQDRPYLALLRTNHRSQPAIRDAAAAINAQDVALLERLPALALPAAPEQVAWRQLEETGGCWFHAQPRGVESELRRVLEQWAWHSYFWPAAGCDYLALLREIELTGADDEPAQTVEGLRTLFRHLERTRLLTMIREGPWGCEQINDFLAERLRQRLRGVGGIEAGDGRLLLGAPVLITRNDKLRELYNGDVGLTLRSRQGLRVAFPRQSGFISLPAEQLPPHELGFALTVHKSQGSEYDQVLVVLPPRGGRRLLTKELLYTAVTRARKLVILSGTAEAVRTAIERRIERDGSLMVREPGPERLPDQRLAWQRQ
jgi:exodeoxyribonuclease V alpha subunit